MAEPKIFADAIKGLDDVAKAEATRLWRMRKEITEINEITLPILILYCASYSQARSLSFLLSTESETLDEEGNVVVTYDYDETLDRLAKVQKIQLTYAKMLHLDEAKKKKSNNKFADLLLGNK